MSKINVDNKQKLQNVSYHCKFLIIKPKLNSRCTYQYIQVCLEINVKLTHKMSSIDHKLSPPGHKLTNSFFYNNISEM